MTTEVNAGNREAISHVDVRKSSCLPMHEYIDLRNGMAFIMKIRNTLSSLLLLLPFGCSISSSDCPNPALKVEKIDFASMTLESGSQVSIFDNNSRRFINTSLTLHFRDGINTTLIPAFDQRDLNLVANGNKINYAHENKVLSGGYGCPEWYYPGLVVKSPDTSIQLIVKDNGNRSKRWTSSTAIDSSTFPVFNFSITIDTFAMSVKPPTSLGTRRPSVQVVEDSTTSYGFTSSIDYFNQYFLLSDFSLYHDTSISEIRKKRYWATIQYSQENVVSLSSPTLIYYAKELPDTISALINNARISRIIKR